MAGGKLLVVNLHRDAALPPHDDEEILEETGPNPSEYIF